MEWISVKDRLPEYFESVLGSDGKEVSVAFRTVEGNWIDEVFELDGDVTHWMPLPSPPIESINK